MSLTIKRTNVLEYIAIYREICYNSITNQERLRNDEERRLFGLKNTGVRFDVMKKSGVSDDNVSACDICGKVLDGSELYEDRFHTALCMECLCALHKI